MRLIIHAPNIHQGGGRALLTALIDALPAGHEYTLLADARLPLPRASPNISLIRVPATLAARYGAERRVAELAGRHDAVLCMGNLPPLFRVAVPIYLLLQNRYLCDSVSLEGFVASTRLRLRAERLWLRARIGDVARVIVQTRSMQDCVRVAFGIEAMLLPFFPGAVSESPKLPAACDAAQRKFLYVASPDPHKNHSLLFDAWRMLAAEGLRPQLHVTLPQTSSQARLAARLREEGVAVINHGTLAAQDVRALYESCDALVFPSTLESFGMPLLEARAAGLAVIAAELDYVRDTLDPDQAFDPYSARSIARAVKRHLRIAESRPAVVSPSDFLRCILSSDI